LSLKAIKKGNAMEEEKMRRTVNDAFHIITLIFLVVIILGILTWSGVTKCSTIPGWCNVYYFVMGEPNILIVYGDTGLGDPFLLENAIEHPQYLGKRAETTHIKNVSPGLLKNYKLVIVDRAKKMSTEQMNLFIEYASTGGKLVWIGDSGTEITEGDELLLESERTPGSEEKAIGPWARKLSKDDGNYMVLLDELLSVEFIGNYCDIKDCGEDQLPFIGYLRKSPGKTHDLILGLDPNLEMRGNFTLVSKRLDKYNNEVLTVDTLSAIIEQKGNVNLVGTNYGDTFTVIMISSPSGLGESVLYYAIPPEYFLLEGQPKKTYLFIENMYYSLLE
jgi:hypothetical protein